MARSDYEGAPQIGADTSAPDNYQHVQTNEDSFGGAIARGVESAATDLNHLYTQTAADDATNQLQQYSNSILNGHPGQGTQGPDGPMVPDTGFLGKRGADAMHAAPQALSELDEKIQEIREGLPTREAQFQFDQESRRYRFNWQAQISSHAREQQYIWAKSVNSVAEQTALNKIGSAPEDNDQFLQGVMALRKAYKSQAALDGLDPSEATMRADQTATLTRVHALMPTNPAMAQQVFDANNKILAGLPNYDALANQVKTGIANAQVGPAADSTVAGAMASAQSMVGIPGKPDIHSAIYAQESGSGANTKTSVTGAMGPMQIQPETFQKFAKPGENIANPTDNRNVGNRIIDHYSQEYHGDAARVATAYFSGEGNVAPAGSPTPWIRDAADPTGKKTSDYVSNVMQRVGGGQTYPSTADAIRANYATTMQAAQDHAQKAWPQYPDVQERYLSHVERGLNRTITQQEQMHEVNVHTVQQALLGPHAPMSEAELTSSSPQVAAAWNDMRLNNPMAAMSVERMFDANSRGKATGFGSNFKDTLDRVLSPATDQERISNASQLWPQVGKGENVALTNTGVSQLSDLIAVRGNPKGEAFASQLKNFADQMHGNLTFTNKSLGIIDKKGEKKYSDFMAQALPILLKANQIGEVNKVLDPKSPDYIGKMAQTFMRPGAEVMDDRINSTPIAALIPRHLDYEGAKAQLSHLDNADQRQAALKAFVQNKSLSLKDATQIAVEHDWIKPPPPDVPSPAP